MYKTYSKRTGVGKGVNPKDADSIEEAKAKAKKDINYFEVLCEYTSEWDFNARDELKNDCIRTCNTLLQM